MFKTGTMMTSKYSPDIEIIVSVDNSDSIPVYEAKWINIDGSLSKASELVFGSQIDDYNIIDNETAESIAKDFNNMDSAIAGFFSQIYK